jgi:hypothetical protein
MACPYLPAKIGGRPGADQSDRRLAGGLSDSDIDKNRLPAIDRADGSIKKTFGDGG